jgi:hypothetical protein
MTLLLVGRGEVNEMGDEEANARFYVSGTGKISTAPNEVLTTLIRWSIVGRPFKHRFVVAEIKVGEHKVVPRVIVHLSGLVRSSSMFQGLRLNRRQQTMTGSHLGKVHQQSCSYL